MSSETPALARSPARHHRALLLTGLILAGSLLIMALLPGPPSAAAQATRSGESVGDAGSPPLPYRNMLDEPVRFTGLDSAPDEPARPEEIRIGLFAGTNDPVSRALRRGAELAVSLANAEGGLRGTPFRLLSRSADDPWGAGARELARLIFEDRVLIVIGGHDSASTHVAQQIATKAHLPLIAPVSSDTSLTHTRVPWIFRLAPDDRTQAESLLEHGLRPRGLTRVTLITSTDHDGRVAAVELVNTLQRAGTPAIAHLTVDPTALDPEKVLERVSRFKPDSAILRLPPRPARAMLDAIQEHGPHVPVLLPWIPGLDPRSLHAGGEPPSSPFEIVALEPFGQPQRCGPYLKLVHHYTRAYGERLPPTAAYAYDATSLAIAALRSGGPDRAAIREHLAAASGTTLATGPLSWDNGGGNLGRPRLPAAPR